MTGVVEHNYDEEADGSTISLFFAYGKIRFARPRSSVDRVSASGAEERSSSLRGGAIKTDLLMVCFCFKVRK